MNQSKTQIEILDLRQSDTQHIVKAKSSDTLLSNVRFTEDGNALVYSEDGNITILSILNDEIAEVYSGPVPGLEIEAPKKKGRGRKNSSKSNKVVEFDFEVVSKDDSKQLIFGFKGGISLVQISSN